VKAARISPFRAVLAVLATLVAGWAAQTNAQPGSATPEQLAALREILARPEFADQEGGFDPFALLAPIRTFLLWLGLTIGRTLAALLRVSGDGPAYTLIGIAAIVAALAGFMVWRLAGGTIAAEGRLEGPRAATRMTAEAELALASAAAREQRWREAIHHRYLAVLRRLDERDLLRFDGSLTNVEYLDRTRDRPGLKDELGPLVGAFDRLWYGDSDCSGADYEAFGALAERALRAAA
jgi:hypothetical protein